MSVNVQHPVPKIWTSSQPCSMSQELHKVLP